MTIDVAAYLRAKGLHLKSAGDNEVHTNCWFCGEDPSKRGRLYINVSSDETLAGLHMCHKCGEKGNLKTLRRHFGDVDEMADEHPFARLAIFDRAAAFYARQIDEATLRYLKEERGLTDDIIARHQIGYAPGDAALGRYLHNECGFDLDNIKATGLIVERGGKFVDFLNRNITIPYHANGAVIQIRGKEVGGKYFTPPGQKARLYNTDAVRGAQEAFICEGEFDALVLEAQGFTAVGAPGAKSWQDSWNGYLDDIPRLFCVFDNDKAGDDGADKLKDVFGPRLKRVLIPKDPTEDKVDVTDWFVTRGGTQEAFSLLCADAVARNSLLIHPMQALEEWTGLQGVEGFKFGIPALDDAIRPGLLPGQVSIILAKTNTGKTIVLLNIFQRAAMLNPDCKMLFISLEQTRGDWFERARRIWNFYNPECPPAEVNRRALEFWSPRMRLVDKNRVSEDELVTVLEDYHTQMGCMPDVVAVDYLGYWASGFKGKGGRYEQVGDAIMSLKAVAKDARVPIITPHQVSRVAEFGQEFSIDQARDSGAVEETGDLVFALWSEDNIKGAGIQDRTGIIRLKIGKARSGGKGMDFALQFAPLTLVMVPKIERTDGKARTVVETMETNWAKDEIAMDGVGLTWEHAMHFHRTGTRPPQNRDEVATFIARLGAGLVSP